MEFYVNLIVVNKKQTSRAKNSIIANCTYICNDVYVMEGDINCLIDDDVDFNFMEEIIVGSLGDLSEKELIEECNSVSSYNVAKLQYDKNKRYEEGVKII